MQPTILKGATNPFTNTDVRVRAHATEAFSAGDIGYITQSSGRLEVTESNGAADPGFAYCVVTEAAASGDSPMCVIRGLADVSTDLGDAGVSGANGAILAPAASGAVALVAAVTNRRIGYIHDRSTDTIYIDGFAI